MGLSKSISRFQVMGGFSATLLDRGGRSHKTPPFMRYGMFFLHQLIYGLSQCNPRLEIPSATSANIQDQVLPGYRRGLYIACNSPKRLSFVFELLTASQLLYIVSSTNSPTWKISTLLPVSTIRDHVNLSYNLIITNTLLYTYRFIGDDRGYQ